jgi:hypothetical protein
MLTAPLRTDRPPRARIVASESDAVLAKDTRLGDWRDLLGRQASVARQILKKLLVGRIVFRETEEGVEFSGQATLGRIGVHKKRW